MTKGSETAERVPKQILGGDTEKNDLTECATINDLTITRGHETHLTTLKGFSTVSAHIDPLISGASSITKENKQAQCELEKDEYPSSIKY